VATTIPGREASPVTTPDPRRRRRRVITWTALAVVAVVAAIAAYWALARSGTLPAPPPIAAASTPPPASTTSAPGEPSSTAGAGARTANGCLGGQDPFQAVIAAAQTATPDQVGAAELAFTFIRWTISYPVDPNAAQVADIVAAPGYRQSVVSGLDQYRRTLLEQGYKSAGTTVGGASQYRIQSGEPGLNPEHVSLDMIVYREATKVDGTVEQVRGYTTVLLDLVDGHWQVSGTLPALGSDPFAPQAGAPWIPFVGVC